MGIILIEFENALAKSKIEMPLVSSSFNEAGEDYHEMHMTDKAQTSVFGIHTPIVMINNIIIDFGDVLSFTLSSKGKLPILSMTVKDRYGLIKNIDKPGVDNEVRVQILPRFEDAYKKINLTFYISKINVYDKTLDLMCTYKLPALTASQYKAFGEIDTYTLFKTIAKETRLGFATNISELSDKRYMYCDFSSYLDILGNEISYADSTNHILDWWIDFWDNINLADIKERYTTVDPDEDIMLWAIGLTDETTVDVTPEPVEMPAVLIDHPAFNTSEMYVAKYDISNSPSSNAAGTDNVYGIYEDSKSDYEDHVIQFGDVKKDIFIHYEYKGENYGDYNYIWESCLRNDYLRNMQIESIKVTLKTPMLALMRGHKVNFIHYVNDENIENRLKTLEEEELINRKVDSNIPLSKYDMPENFRFANGNFLVDRTVSAQYLIKDVEISYNEGEWDYVLTLIKPLDTKVKLINEE